MTTLTYRKKTDYDKSIQNRRTTLAIFVFFFTYPSEGLAAIAFGM